MSKPTTKSSLPSLEDRFATTEKAHAEAVAASSVRAEELTSQLATARDAVDSADERVSEVERAIARGESRDSDMLGAARLDAEAARLRLTDLEAQLRRAKAPKATQIEGALGLVPAIKLALPGVPVYCTAADLPELTEPDAPLVIIRQTEDSSALDGSLSTSTLRRSSAGRHTRPGVEVEVHYLRSVIHRELDRSRLADAFRRLDIKAELGFGYRTSGAGSAHVDRMTVRSGEPSATPVIEQVAHAAPSHTAAGQFVHRLGLAVAQSANELVHESTDLGSIKHSESDGIRTTVVTGTTRLRRPERPGRGAEASGSPESHVGEFVAGLGRVVAVEVDRSAIDVCRWTARFASRTSHDVSLTD